MRPGVSRDALLHSFRHSRVKATDKFTSIRPSNLLLHITEINTKGLWIFDVFKCC